tara:strand:+ start:4002 stop:4742 length:741 start_codon:yes stop_codon:yes gene_type:complete
MLTCYDPDLPIHLKDTVQLIKNSNIHNKCNICNEEMENCLLVCENGCICCKDCEPDYFTKGSRRSKICKQCNGKALDFPINNPITNLLIKNMKSIEVEMSHGLTQIKNHGYVTEGMANGEIAPDWVPISRIQAMKEVMGQLNTNTTNNPPHVSETIPNEDTETNSKKMDKRKRSAHTEEEWKEIQEKRLTMFREKQKTKKQKIEDYDNLFITVQKQKLEIEEKDAKIKYLEEVLQNKSMVDVEFQV